jgi:predicted GNAT family acetyltransferase
MDMVVRDNPERSRYELLVDDVLVGIADYVIDRKGASDGDRMGPGDGDGTVLVFPHTVIDADRRGQGLGAVLIAGALDDVRAKGRTVVPRCWFVAEFIEQNADYADLLAG